MSISEQTTAKYNDDLLFCVSGVVSQTRPPTTRRFRMNNGMCRAKLVDFEKENLAMRNSRQMEKEIKRVYQV